MIVDARGHRCPVPTLKLRRALESADRITLIADDPMARIDVPHFLRQVGATLLDNTDDGGVLTFTVAAPSNADRRPG